MCSCNVSDDNYTEFRSQVKAYIKSKVTTLAIIATAIVVVEVCFSFACAFVHCSEGCARDVLNRLDPFAMR